MVIFEEEEGEEVITKVKARPRSPPPVVLSSSSSTCSTRGLQTKPVVRRILSEPTLKRKDLPMEAEAKCRLNDFRTGLDQDLCELDAAAIVRRRNQSEAEYAAKAEVAMRRHYQRSIDAQRAPERPAWNYVEPMTYFSMPEGDKGGTSDCPKNEQQQGAHVLPARREVNSTVGWKDSDVVMREFATKPLDHMGPSERRYAKKLEERLCTIDAQNRSEQALLKNGKFLRQRAKASGGEFSALNRTKPPWTTQVTCQTYFAATEPSQPGMGGNDPHLKEFIEQPERAMSFHGGIIVGDNERTCHWKPRTGPAGSSHRQAKARELLCPPCLRGKASAT